MPTPEANPTDPRPDQAPATDQSQKVDNKPDSTTTSQSTQEHMGDGAGIRGDYGDASQTNGLEGGPNETPTNTELTGA